MTNNVNRDMEPPARNLNSLYFWVLGGLLALLLYGVTLCPRPQHIPPEIEGVWTTNEALHSDRSMEISAAYVSFATGERTASTGMIRHFKSEPQGAEILYTIKYDSDDGPDTIWLLYDPSTKVLRFKNQPGVKWQKSSND